MFNSLNFSFASKLVQQFPCLEWWLELWLTVSFLPASKQSLPLSWTWRCFCILSEAGLQYIFMF